MMSMTFVSACCSAPVHAETSGSKTVLRCSACKKRVDTNGKPYKPAHEREKPSKLFPRAPKGSYVLVGLKGGKPIEMCSQHVFLPDGSNTPLEAPGYVFAPYCGSMLNPVKKPQPMKKQYK